MGLRESTSSSASWCSVSLHRSTFNVPMEPQPQTRDFSVRKSRSRRVDGKVREKAYYMHNQVVKQRRQIPDDLTSALLENTSSKGSKLVL
ncbi:hypothetical protein AHAS_Ahas11G0329900 [Arachis hypogaea]